MKRKLVFLQLFVAIIMVCTSVYAAFDTTIGVTVSSSTLYKGDTVDVTISLKNVDSSKKITNVEGYINYNKDILEQINYESIVKNEDKTVKIGDETLKVEDLTNISVDDMSSLSAYVGFNASPLPGNDVKLLIDFKSGITKDTDLLTIKFKLKSDAQIGDIQNAIQCSKFVVKAGEEKSEEISKNINLTIKEAPKEDNQKTDDTSKNEAKQDDKKNENKSSSNDKTQDPVGAANNNNTNKNANTNKSNTNINKTNTNTNTDDSVSGKKLPAAGAKVLVVPAIVLITIAYITYNRYIRMRGI